ncbi:hypothetical protein NWP22_00630 [Anabaenopsis tanganyikae CS-531]|uniref:Uncharacterized protein n=1 Tax=Anabaenopsis tanganyikae CS-531 TaxID=2785304 RepID=A0ABT6K9D2_9CYAN|nr:MULTISPECIES: hypothetical protein [Anabaenopsis]MDH6104404.1 hypothetical protein [Anabaenopsis tanganyikae CS-531]
MALSHLVKIIKYMIFGVTQSPDFWTNYIRLSQLCKKSGILLMEVRSPIASPF